MFEHKIQDQRTIRCNIACTDMLRRTISGQFIMGPTDQILYYILYSNRFQFSGDQSAVRKQTLYTYIPLYHEHVETFHK